MTDTDPTRIATTVEPDGSVMMNAADVVAWLRHCAEQFGSGIHGGLPYACKSAQEALVKTADGIQSAYIDTCADEVTRWFGGLA